MEGCAQVSVIELKGMGRKGMIAKPTNAARGKVCKQACILRMDESGDGIKLSTNIHVAHLGNEPKLLRYLVFQRCRDGLVTADLSSARAGLCETLIEHDKATLVASGETLVWERSVAS
jgi:hypothetical protein